MFQSRVGDGRLFQMQLAQRCDLADVLQTGIGDLRIFQVQ
jgi:hypothetical protein